MKIHDIVGPKMLEEHDKNQWSTPRAPKALQAKYDAIDFERNPTLTGRIEMVPLNKIYRVQPGPPDVKNVMELQTAYNKNPLSVPEPILLRHGSFYAAVDGDHRVEAKIRNGDTEIRANVLPSPLRYELRRTLRVRS